LIPIFLPLPGHPTDTKVLADSTKSHGYQYHSISILSIQGTIVILIAVATCVALAPSSTNSKTPVTVTSTTCSGRSGRYKIKAFSTDFPTDGEMTLNFPHVPPKHKWSKQSRQYERIACMAAVVIAVASVGLK